MVSCTEHAGDDHEARSPLRNPANDPELSAAHVFTVPESGHDAPCPVTVNPPPST